MAKVKYDKNGRPSWELDDDEKQNYYANNQSYYNDTATIDKLKSDVESIGNSVYDTYNNAIETGTYLDRQNSRQLTSDIYAYRNALRRLGARGFDIDDALDSSRDLMSYKKYATQALHDVYDSQEYQNSLIGWLPNRDADDYDPTKIYTSENIEARTNRYNSQKARLDELNELIDGYSNSMMGTRFADGMYRNANGDSITEDEYNALVKERDDLQTDNNRYEREQQEQDRYSSYRLNSDFEQNSSRRTSNPSRDEITMSDADYDAQAQYIESLHATNQIEHYDADTDEFVLVNGTRVPNVTEPNAIVDKLGVYLDSTSEDIANAYDELELQNDSTNQYASVLREGDDGNWKSLTDEEISLYYYLLNTEGQESAYQYLDYMAEELGRRENEDLRAKYQDANWYERLGMNAQSVAGSVLGGPVALASDVIDLIQGNDINQYDALHRAYNYATTVREEGAQNWNDATGNVSLPYIGTTFGDVYQAIMSGADSLAGAMLFGKAYTFLMGTSSAVTKARELYNSGASESQIVKGALASGIIEILTEKVSLDHFLKQGTPQGFAQLMKNALAQAGVEASEEFASEVSNIMFDTYNLGTQSDWYKWGEEGKNQFLTALAQAVNSAIGGFISGGGMSVGGGVVSGTAQSANNRSTNLYTGQQMAGNDSINTLLDYANNNDVSQKTKDLISKAETSLNNENKSRSDYRNIGAFANSVTNEITETNAKAEIKAELEKSGQNASSGIVDAVYKKATNQMLTRAESKALRGINTDAIINKVMSEDFTETINEKNASTYVDATVDRINRADIKSKYEDSVSESGKATNESTGEEIRIKDIANFDDGHITFNLDNGETITSDNVKYGSTEEAYLYDSIATMGVSPAVANAIVDGFNNYGKNANRYITNVKLAQMYGRANEALLARQLDLPVELRDKLFAIGRDERVSRTNKLEEESKKKSAPKKQSTKVHNVSGIDTSKLTGKRKAVYDVANFISKSTALDVYLISVYQKNGKYYYMDNGVEIESSANGWYVSGTNKIYIDINAGVNMDGLGLFTLAHESGHFIREWNAKAWQEMADLIVETIDEKSDATGETFSGLLSQKQRQYEELRDNGHKDYQVSDDKLEDMAYEDVICDALSSFMADENTFIKFSNDLKATNKQTWNKFKKFFQDFLNRLKNVLSSYNGANPDQVSGRIIKEANDVYNKIQDLYVKAFEGANENYENASNVVIDSASESVAPTVVNSERTWTESEYIQAKEQTAQKMHKELGITVAEAEQYIDNVNSIAKIIANDRVRLDYIASEGVSSFVGNSEYGGSIDFSTICKKRRLLTGTFSAIQKLLPNTALTAEEVLTIRKMMDDKGYEVSCGLCYVEGSRAKMGEYAKDFLNKYAKTNPEYLPNMAEINTPEGIEKIRMEHPDVYEAYSDYMNGLSQRKPKLYQMSTEYKGEVLDKFKKSTTVDQKNKNGGLRLQSFSDFEIIHLIDSMQVIMDMSRVGLAGQAYTKVADFASALGDTGLKINLSLIAKGVDKNGRLILDEKEGMKRADAEKLRNQYSDNVGTILVVFNDEQLKSALADDFIDYIIPFHRSQWNSTQYNLMGLPESAKDYTKWQNESYIEPVYNKNGKKTRPSNYMPNEYWDFSKTGKENAEEYLRMCAMNNRLPKFSNLLVNNGDGSYSLQSDGSTDGYWKLLIDFKMYNNDGVGVPQNPVMPNFNMEEAYRMLDEYKGGHEQFPVAQDIVDEFVSEYNKNHPQLYSLRMVEPIEPTSNDWTRSVTTEEAMNIYPDLWNVSADESETRNPTQIATTTNTYRKIYEILKSEDFDGNILDASSGLGYGTNAGIEEYGFDVDDIEPYPSNDYNPKFTDYSSLNNKYDVIISNAVLNVLPQDQRDALVKKMGELLNDGGRMFVNVRSLSEIQALQNVVNKKTGELKNITISESEVAETSKGSYQKGFTKRELVSYLNDALGGGYIVNPTNKFGTVSAIVIKNPTLLYDQRYKTDNYYSNIVPASRKDAEHLNMLDERNIARYRNEIDGVFDGTLDSGKDVIIGMPSDILLDNDVSNRLIHIKQSIVRKIAYPSLYKIGHDFINVSVGKKSEGHMGGKHNLGISAVKNLPLQIADPIAITKNNETNSNRKSVVLWSNWISEDGYGVMLGLVIDSNGATGLQNNISTVFQAEEDYAKRFFENEEDILYTRNKKDINELLSDRRYMPKAMVDDTFVKNINRFNKDVNRLSSERTSNAELANRDDTALFIKNTDKANYIGMIFNGTKTEETRSTRSLDKFIGKEFFVTDGNKVYGSIVLGEPHKISAEDFHKRENQLKHRVPKGDTYDVKEGGFKWAYPIESYNKYDKPKALSSDKDYLGSYQARQIKYSERDTRYLELAKNPEQNEAELRKMVREEAKKNGYTSVGYHGTRKGGYTVFNPNFAKDQISMFFSNDTRTAISYSGDEYVFGEKRNYNKLGYSSLNYIIQNLIEPSKVKNLQPEGNGKYVIRGFSMEKGSFDIKEFDSIDDVRNWVINNHPDALDNYMSGVYTVYLKTENPLVVDGGINIDGEVPRVTFSYNTKEDYVGITYWTPLGNFSERISKYDVETYASEYFKKDSDDVIDAINKAVNGNVNVSEVRNVYVTKTLSSNWNNIPFNGEKTNTRSISKYAYDNGYDSVIIKNITDNGGYSSNELVSSDITIVFDPKSIKMSNPVTYDDNGEIIPLSERFNAENDDIRFSERDTSASPRNLLANALESTAQTELEQKKIAEYKENIDKLNEQERILDTLKSELKELSFAKGKRDNAKIGKLKEDITKTQNRINNFDKKLLSLESTKPLKAVLVREKANLENKYKAERREAVQYYMKRNDELVQKYRDRNKLNKSRQEYTDTKSEIRKIVEDLTKRLQNPTERRFIPTDLAQAVIDVCNAIDYTGRTYFKAGTDEVDVERTRANNKESQKFINARDALNVLKSRYDSLKTNENFDFSSEFDEEFSSHIDELINAVGDTPLREMNADQLADTYDILSDIYNMITYASRQIGVENAIANYELGSRMISEMKEIKDLGLTSKQVSSWFREWMDNPMRAVREMSAFKEGAVLLEQFNKLNEGRIKADKFKMDMQKKFDLLRMSKEGEKAFNDAVEKANIEVTDKDGNNVMLTKMQAMQAILTYERENSNSGRSHLVKPVRFTNIKDESKGNNTKAFDNGFDVFVDEDLVKYLESKMTSWDNAYLNVAREFFNEDAKNAVNEISMITRHRFIATENNYIPYVVNKNQVKAEIGAMEYEATINSFGILKSTKNNAKQQLIMRGLNQIVSDHIDQVAKIYGLTIPIRNFNKVFNVSLMEDDVADSKYSTVQDAISQTWGTKGNDLIKQAVKDIQTPRRSDVPKIIAQAKSGIVASTLASNLSVWMKQSASYFTAGSILSSGSLAKGLASYNTRLGRGIHAVDIWNEIDEHTPQHYMRRAGLSLQELGEMNQSKGWVNKVNKKLGNLSPMNWIQAMDVATTTALWEATKAEVESRGLTQSNENYWDEVTKLYNQVLEETQPMYDPLHRSEITKNKYLSNFVIFQTQPMQNSGILRDGAVRYKMAKKEFGNNSAEAKEAGRMFRMAVTSQLASHFVFTAMTLISAMLLHKVNNWRDEDKNLTLESVGEEFLKELFKNIFGAVLPVIGNYAFSIGEKFFSGNRYDIISDPVVDKINDTVTSLAKLKTPSTNNFINAFCDVASYFGVPVKNAYNIVHGAFLHVEDAMNGEFGSFEAGVERTKRQELGLVYDAIMEGDTESVEEFKAKYDDKYNRQVADALVEFDERITQSSQYKYDGDFENYLSTAMEIKNEGYFTQDQIVTAINTVINQLEKENGTDESSTSEPKHKGFFENADLEYALSTGNDEYIEMVADDLEGTKVENGKTDEESHDYVSGAVKNDVKELFNEGIISYDDAIDYLYNYADFELEDAEEKVRYWNYVLQYPDTVLTESKVSAYYDYAEPYGITPEYFEAYYIQAESATGVDYNGDGRADTGTKKTEILEIIDSLPISDAQKDALYFASGYKESTLSKAPWH